MAVLIQLIPANRRLHLLNCAQQAGLRDGSRVVVDPPLNDACSCHVFSVIILTAYLCLFAVPILTVYLNSCDGLDMSAAVRSRTAARGWVTRAGNAIRDLFIQPVDYFALQTACDEFDMRLNALDNAQSLVELEIDE